MSDGIKEKLRQGIVQLKMELKAPQVQLLVDYLTQLTKWNKAYNLTAIRDPLQMVTRHLLDSLAILPYLKGERILDVGTGAGLPGIPLAIAEPERFYCLLDSNGKKCRFLQQTVLELGLKNVRIVEDRAEHFANEQCFDSIVARAVSTVNEIIDNTSHLICPQGQWLLMKGQYPADELEGIAGDHTVIAYQVPGLDEQRHLVCVTRGSQG